MNFTKILEELKKGKKATREKWEKDKTKRYKYIQLEHGKCIAFLKDDVSKDIYQGLDYMGCIFDIGDFTAEDWKIYQENPTQMWKPQMDETYYSIDRSGIIFGTNNVEFDMDRRAIELGNCFKTKEEAEHMVEKIKIINKLRELSNTRSIYNQDKFIIYYNFQENKVSCGEINYTKVTPFEVYFKTREDCENAVKEIGEDNLKKYYFDIAEVEEEK